METYLSIIFFILGTLIASFIGVVVARLNTGESIVSGRSRCDACARPLDIFDLVPLLSYAAMGGRSRCCGAQLSPLAPLMELLLGGLYVLAYLQVGLGIPLLLLCIALALVLALVLYDLAHMVLPDTLLIPLVLVSVFFAFLQAPEPQAFLAVLLAALAVGGILLAMHFLSGGRWMGLADAPLAFALALIAGPAAISGFVYTFWVGAVIGVVLLLARPRGSRMGVEVPFAPFLALGFLLAYFTQWDLFIHIADLL